MTLDPEELAPGKLLEEDGHFTLIYTDVFTHEELFASRGLRGGGYAWRCMVLHMLEENAPEALDALELDPEPDMVRALSDEPDALRAVAAVLRRLQDVDRVRRIVEYVDLRQYE